MATVPDLDPAAVSELAARLRAAVLAAVKAPDEVMRDIIVALLAEGHVLVEDNPGVGKTVVSESGIYTRDQLDELERVGVDAVLVGETVMRAPDPEAAVRELVRTEEAD